MKMLTFAKRCAKEILRDPLTLAFGLGFPLILLFLLSAMQANIPVPLFAIDTLTPGITVFGLSFMTLFSATLVAKDRESAFLQRLYTSPLRAADFILGYMLPLLPIALAQTLICYAAAIPLGLTVSINILYAIIGILPMAAFNIALGLLCGSLLGSSEDRLRKLAFEQIECITVLDRKVIAIDTGGDHYRIQERLRDLEAVLPSYFIRINKSTLANEHRIVRFDAVFSGGVDAVFQCGYREYVSRRCFAEIKRRYEGA